MIKNRVVYLSDKDIFELRRELSGKDSLYVVEINGEDVQNREEYLAFMSEAFRFPIPSRGFDGYLDWITDLDWLHKEEYVLIINHYKEFMKKDPGNKKEIIEMFQEDILPFWEGEVEVVFVGGKAKKFNVYLVD